MQPCAAGFADGEQPLDARFAVHVGLDPAADEVGGRHHRNQVLRHIDAGLETLSKDVRETAAQRLLVVMADIQVYALFAGTLHFGVDRARHDVARRKTLHRVIFLHEFDRLRVARLAALQNRALPAQRLADQERTDGRMVEDGRMELDEFHICDLRARPVGHGDAGAAGDIRIARVQIDLPGAAAGDRRRGRKHGHDGAVLHIEHIRAETAVRTAEVQPVADHEVHGDMVFENPDVRLRTDRFDHHALKLGAGDVPGVQNPALVVAALPAEVILVRILGITEVAAGRELRAEVDEFADRFGAGLDDGADRTGVAEPGAGLKRILHMLLERVEAVDHAGDAALGKTAVALEDFTLGHDRDAAAGFGQMQRARQSGQTAADHKMVEFLNFTDFHFAHTLSLGSGTIVRKREEPLRPLSFTAILPKPF